MNKIIDELLKLSKIAYEQNEVPISALVVDESMNIIGKGYNQKIKLNDITAHAEVLALKKAADKLGDWRLSNCDLYVTLEPCNMCKEIIKEARIKNVYYLVKKDENKLGFYKTNIRSIDISTNIDKIEEYKQQLRSFFELKR